jgi:hypothetical protein
MLKVKIITGQAPNLPLSKLLTMTDEAIEHAYNNRFLKEEIIMIKRSECKCLCHSGHTDLVRNAQRAML